MLAPDPPFWFHRKLKRLQVEIISGFEKKSGYTTKLSGFKSYRIQSSHFKFRIQNLRRHDQTGKFLFRIRPLSCKRQKESGTKTFRIHHESGTISSSVNLVLLSFCYDKYLLMAISLHVYRHTFSQHRYSFAYFFI